MQDYYQAEIGKMQEKAKDCVCKGKLDITKKCADVSKQEIKDE